MKPQFDFFFPIMWHLNLFGFQMKCLCKLVLAWKQDGKKKQLENLLLITAKHYHVDNILKFHAEIPDMYSQNSYILLVPATSQILTKQ